MRFEAARIRHADGFSLIELVITVAVLTLLAGLAAPGMFRFFDARRVEGVARRLTDDMSRARSEAVKRNVVVLLCADLSVADGGCGTDWTKGWKVCVDKDVNEVCDEGSSSDPNPIRVQSALGDTLEVTGPQAKLRFSPDGSLAAASFDAFTMASKATPSLLWRVRFAPSGAISVRKG